MQIKELYHHCFECDDIQEGDCIPVASDSFSPKFAKTRSWKVKADFEAIYPEFAGRAQRNRIQFETEAWQSYFAQRLPDVDPKLLTVLQTFTTAFEEERTSQNNSPAQRREMYDTAQDHCVSLSEVFKTKQAMCVEIAVLAKKFLDEQGIKSRLFSGEEMQHYVDDQPPNAHTFLIIEHRGQEYIFDPANPTEIKGDKFFSLFKPTVSFSSREEELKKDSFMIAAENVIDHQRHYFGVGDCLPVWEGRVIHGNVSEQVKDAEPLREHQK